ncbi:MAG: hypothetical protein ABJN26_14035 [Stappiaceae bacterium]
MPARQPEVPQLYKDMCEKFGEENTKRAMGLQRFVKNEFPHLRVSNHDDFERAAGILILAERSIKVAAEDGRGHSMSETLANFEKQAADILKSDPEQIPLAARLVYYGDENKGRMSAQIQADANRQRVKAENKRTIGQIALIIFGPALVFGGLAASKPGGIEFFEVFSITAGSFAIVLALMAIVGYFFD